MKRLPKIAALLFVPLLLCTGAAAAVNAGDSSSAQSEIWLTLGIAAVGLVGLIAMRHHIQRL